MKDLFPRAPYMNSIGTLLAGACLLTVLAAPGQAQKPAGLRSRDISRPITRLGDKDSLASWAAAAGPETIVPRLMKFSGVLHDAAGKALSGTVDVTFALYGAESGGSPLWFETQSVQADELGRYTALLGAMHSDGLPIDLFTSGEVRWLGIQVGSEAEQPRVLLVSVPYALKAGDAETLGGKPASAYMLSHGQSGTASTSLAVSSGGATLASVTNPAVAGPLTACSSVTSDGTAAVNSIALFTTACTVQSSNLIQYNGNLGFGTTLPQARLHIFGPTAPDADARFNFILGDSSSAAAGYGGGILFSGYYSGTSLKAGFANIRGVKENNTQGNYASALIFDTRLNGGNQTERLRITSSGSMGIGTSTPGARLDVEPLTAPPSKTTGSGTNGTAGLIVLGQTGGSTSDSTASGGTGGGLTLTAGDGGANGGAAGGGGAQVQILPGKGAICVFLSGCQDQAGDGGNINLLPGSSTVVAGAVNIGTTTGDSSSLLTVFGDVAIGQGVASGDPGCLSQYNGPVLTGTCSSDERLKKDITPFPNLLDKVALLQPVHFNWRVDEFPKYHFGPQRNSGLIAQQVEKVFPDMVATDKNGYKMVDYSRISLLTLEAVRELKAQDDLLRRQNRAQQLEIRKLALQVKKLKQDQTEMAALKSRLDRLEGRESVAQSSPASGATQPGSASAARAGN